MLLIFLPIYKLNKAVYCCGVTAKEITPLTSTCHLVHMWCEKPVQLQPHWARVTTFVTHLKLLASVSVSEEEALSTPQSTPLWNSSINLNLVVSTCFEEDSSKISYSIWSSQKEFNVSKFTCFIGCFLFLFFIFLTSVGLGNSWRKERKKTPSFMTQFYLVFVCGQKNITFSPTQYLRLLMKYCWFSNSSLEIHFLEESLGRI